MEGYRKKSLREKIEYTNIGIFSDDDYKKYENEWNKIKKGKDNECEQMLKKFMDNEWTCSDIVSMILFVCELYDTYYKKESGYLDEKDEELFINFSSKSRIIKRQISKTNNVLKTIKACSQKDNTNIKKNIRKSINEAINARHMDSEVEKMIKEWDACCKMYVSSKEVFEWIMFIWKNQGITKEYLQQIFYKAKVGVNQIIIDNLAYQVEIERKKEEEIKGYREINSKLCEGNVTLEDIKGWLQKEICILKEAKVENNLAEVEKREKLLLQIKQENISTNDASLEWMKINNGVINTYIIIRLREQEEELKGLEILLKTDYSSAEECFGKLQEEYILLSDILSYKQAIGLVIEAIQNNTIYEKENKELKQALRQLEKLYADRDKTDELDIVDLMKICDKYEIEHSIGCSFEKWILENEREKEYLKTLIIKVFISDLIIPDIMSDFIIGNLTSGNNYYEYERVGKIDDLNGTSHVENLLYGEFDENKTIGSFDADINKWIKNGFDKSENNLIVGDEGKIQKNPRAKIMRIHSLWIPFIDLVNSDKTKTKEFLFAGKLEENDKRTVKSSKYCSQVDNIIESSFKCIERMAQPLKEFNTNCTTKVELSIEVRKAIADMTINKLVGHRYATDIGEFIINIGKREMAGRYDKTYVKKVTLETMSKLQKQKIPIVSVDGADNWVIKQTFIDACVKLPPYWQSVFWAVLYEYINQLQDKFYSIAGNAIKDKDRRDVVKKNSYLQDEAFLNLMNEIVYDVVNELNKIYSDKLGIIFYILRERCSDIKEGGGLSKNMLSEAEINEIIAIFMESEKLSDIAEWIWRNMIDFDYYKENTSRNQDFQILRDKNNPNKFGQRKTNQVYDAIGKTYLKFSR